jgi:predicted kinase
MRQTGLPRLVIVTGRPASGKTTLAHQLSSEIGYPLVSRDELMEGLVNTLERGGRIDTDPKWHVFNLFFQTIEILLGNGISIIAEAAFQHGNWIRGLEPVLDFTDIRTIICTVSPELARERFESRRSTDPDRSKYHDGARSAEDCIPVVYDVPDLGCPSIEVDTADGCTPTLDEIVEFILN